MIQISNGFKQKHPKNCFFQHLNQLENYVLNQQSCKNMEYQIEYMEYHMDYSHAPSLKGGGGIMRCT